MSERSSTSRGASQTRSSLASNGTSVARILERTDPPKSSVTIRWLPQRCFRVTLDLADLAQLVVVEDDDLIASHESDDIAVPELADGAADCLDSEAEVIGDFGTAHL